MAVRNTVGGRGLQSFDYQDVHFIGLVNVLTYKADHLGALGAEHLEWLEKDVAKAREQHADRGLRSRAALGRLSPVGVGHWR